ncbi:hypothetical protein AZO1586I_1458, partial [Bathymodiolus thermophilus thioautotrophic gill symbiont]
LINQGEFIPSAWVNRSCIFNRPFECVVECYFNGVTHSGFERTDFRLSRNLLKGQVGDEINVLMAACAWNLRKWLVIATIFLFWQKLGLFFVKYLRFFVVLDKKQFC